jgi:hypothetical protein
VQILEHEDHGPDPARGGQEVLEGAAHLVTEQDPIPARGPELDALVVRERDAGELAHEHGDALDLVSGEVTGDPGEQLATAHIGGLAVEHAEALADGLAEHPER